MTGSVKDYNNIDLSCISLTCVNFLLFPLYNYGSYLFFLIMFYNFFVFSSVIFYNVFVIRFFICIFFHLEVIVVDVLADPHSSLPWGSLGDSWPRLAE